ncbi:longitudinals lacking protein-like isoform X4 [Bacillus rossius redtenbacheri]|uniref:longitudinals lacking protein-like isoform X4 n=1 Tax=Bacillus rossius redtenbacheri TaxID=93214 RepID=UPI002FDCF241
MMEARSEQLTLQWDDFHSNLSTSFHSLLQGEELVDVTLAADGRFIQAHKLVLSVCSPYFKSLFKANPCQHPIVILKDVGHKELVDVLQFMYRGEVSVGQEDLAEFLKTAELLQVKGLAGDDADVPEVS